MPEGDFRRGRGSVREVLFGGVLSPGRYLLEYAANKFATELNVVVCRV